MRTTITIDDYIERKIREKGVTVVPLKFYLNEKRRIKVEIALVKGKKSYDKREAIKKKDLAREMKREAKYKY